jgi:hypothetical protein
MAAFSGLHQDLATANRHIAERQAQIAQQAKLVGTLAADGHDATNARHLTYIERPRGPTIPRGSNGGTPTRHPSTRVRAFRSRVPEARCGPRARGPSGGLQGRQPDGGGSAATDIVREECPRRPEG